MNTRLLPICVATLAIIGSVQTEAQKLPPIRPIGRVIRMSGPNSLGSVTAVRALSSGGVIVNDIVRRQLVLFDSTLTFGKVILDSATSTGGTFGAQSGGIIRYKGDSTIFVDPSTLSMLVIDPLGRIARVMAAPRPEDAAYMVGGPFGTPEFDMEGRLIYRGMARPIPVRPLVSSSNAPPFQLPEQPDSAPIVRFDFLTRKTDTLGMFKTPKSVTKISRTEDGGMSITLP